MNNLIGFWPLLLVAEVASCWLVIRVVSARLKGQHHPNVTVPTITMTVGIIGYMLSCL